MLKGILKYGVLPLLLAVVSSTFATEEINDFSSEVLRDRYQELVQELRCPKCQNQNLADSNSPIAADLRAEIFRMLEEGKNDREIVDFLVARYGEFVRYRPSVNRNTLLLWGIPIALLLLGIALFVVIGRRQRLKLAAPTELDESEKARLVALLQQRDERGDKE